MLRQLLALFQQTPGPVSLELLAAQLDVDAATLQGMLSELVRMGRLVRVEDHTAGCSLCGFKDGCPYRLTTGSVYYALPGSAGCAVPPPEPAQRLDMTEPA